MHRRCLLTSTPLPQLTRGMLLPILDKTLLLDPDHELDFSRALVLPEPPLPGSDILPIEGLCTLMPQVYRELLKIQPPVGFGILIPLILKWMEGDYPALGEPISHVKLAPARQAVGRILTCLREKDISRLPHATRSLVGLGEGLTPSGDDFLGGMYFALFLWGKTHPGLMDDLMCTSSEFIHQCRHLTNDISFTMLLDHIHGHALYPLHAFAHDLLEGRPVNILLPHARGLIAVGHSTGWDLLTGFLGGMSAACALLLGKG